MLPSQVLALAQSALMLVLTIAGPLLLTSLIVGTVIGLLQALTQIQETTLTFVPKLLAMGLVLLLMLPTIGQDDAIPGRIRLMIAFALSAAMYGLVGAPARVAAEAGAALPAVLVAELMTGLAMGMIVKILFFAVSMAGSVISTQIGLSSAVIFDPAQSSAAPQLSKFVAMAAALVCMGMQVHHLWLGAIVHSYQSFPVGGLPPAHDFAMLAVEAITRSMTLGLSLAAPLLIYGIVFNVALGLAARVAPAIQVFFIAQPLNLLLGISLAAATLGTMLTFFARAMGDAMQGGW